MCHKRMRTTSVRRRAQRHRVHGDFVSHRGTRPLSKSLHEGAGPLGRLSLRRLIASAVKIIGAIPVSKVVYGAPVQGDIFGGDTVDGQDRDAARVGMPQVRVVGDAFDEKLLSRLGAEDMGEKRGEGLLVADVAHNGIE